MIYGFCMRTTAAPARIKINVFTGGCKILGLDDIKENYFGKDSLRAATEDAMRSKMNDDFLKIDVVYSCIDTSKFDPNYMKAYRSHWGEYAYTMERMLHKEIVKEVLTKLKKDLAKAEQDGQEYFNVAFLCRMGRHRSICLSRFARWCLERANYVIENVVHTARILDGRKWARDGLCTTCSDCKLSWMTHKTVREKVKHVQEQVCRLWDEMV